jgi:predicted DCC family thiol-disulfide oxidoreductase YuxK
MKPHLPLTSRAGEAPVAFMIGLAVAAGVGVAVALSCLMVVRLADRRESGVPLGLFRIAYGSVLLCEVGQMLYYAPLIQDPVPFLVRGEIRLTYLLVAWLVALGFLTVGLFTRTAAIVSYVAGLCSTSVFREFEYHVDYILTGMNLLMAIAPVSRRLSLDQLRARLAAAAGRGPAPPLEVSRLYRKLFVFVGIALVYVDSVFWKLDSPMWMAGLGVWLPASLPQAVWYDYSPILDREWLARGLGYMTLVFEAVFIFLMWIEAAAIPLAIVGLGLHLGITAVFPIPWFGLLVTTIYLLVIPPGLYRWIGKRFRFGAPWLTFFYDDTCRICERTRIVIEHFDVRRAIAFRSARRDAGRYPALADVPLAALLADVYSIDAAGHVYRGVDTYRRVAALVWPFAPLGWLMNAPGLRQLARLCYRNVARRRQSHTCAAGACGPFDLDTREAVTAAAPAWVPLARATRLGLGLLIATLIVCQSAAVVQAPLAGRWIARRAGQPVASALARHGSVVTRSFSQPLFGVTPHTVFLDFHFVGYNHIVAVVYEDPGGKDVWLPIIRPNGQVHWMTSGRLWVFWTFRSMSPYVNPARLNLGVKRMTAFWMERQGISPRNATFRILVKRVEVPARWERGFLARQKERPWVDGGSVTWRNGTFHAEIKNVETL